MEETLDTVAAKLNQLSRSVDERFSQVDQRFSQVDERFAQVDERFEQIDRRFEHVLSEIAAEAERTRRHFDVVAEKLIAERNLALDRSIATAEQVARLAASNAADHIVFERRLDDHETRLTDLESRKPRDA
jgi:tetrahydromethanopterin S-methyltransferase subunit G